MDARDADVMDRIDFVTHDLGGYLGFFGNRQIARACAQDSDLTFAEYGCVALNANGTRIRIVARIGMVGPDALRRFGGRASDQHIACPREQCGGDRGDLVGSFPFAEDHLGHAVSQGSMMIHLGEAQVFERQRLHPLHGRIHVHGAFLDVSQQLS